MRTDQPFGCSMMPSTCMHFLKSAMSRFFRIVMIRITTTRWRYIWTAGTSGRIILMRTTSSTFFAVDGSQVWINGDATRHVGVEYVSARSDIGYVVEAQIPLANIDVLPTPGIQFGIQFHVDDDDDGGDVDRALSWSTHEPLSWLNTSLFGTAILGEATAARYWLQMDRTAGVVVDIYQLERPLPALYRLAPNQLPNISFTASTINFSPPQTSVEPRSFVAEIEGILETVVAGNHEFEITSDDGSRGPGSTTSLFWTTLHSEEQQRKPQRLTSFSDFIHCAFGISRRDQSSNLSCGGGNQVKMSFLRYRGASFSDCIITFRYKSRYKVCAGTPKTESPGRWRRTDVGASGI